MSLLLAVIAALCAGACARPLICTGAADSDGYCLPSAAGGAGQVLAVPDHPAAGRALLAWITPTGQELIANGTLYFKAAPECGGSDDVISMTYRVYTSGRVMTVVGEVVEGSIGFINGSVSPPLLIRATAKAPGLAGLPFPRRAAGTVAVSVANTITSFAWATGPTGDGIITVYVNVAPPVSVSLLPITYVIYMPEVPP